MVSATHPLPKRSVAVDPGMANCHENQPRFLPTIDRIEGQKPNEPSLKWATCSPQRHISHFLYYLNRITNSSDSAQRALTTASLKRYSLFSSYAVLRTSFESSPDCLGIMLLMPVNNNPMIALSLRPLYLQPPPARKADKSFIALLHDFLAYGHESYWVQKWSDTMYSMQRDKDHRLVAFWGQQYMYWRESASSTTYGDNEYMAFPSAFAHLIFQAAEKPTTLFRDSPEVAACFDWLVVWLFRAYLTGVALTPILLAFYQPGAQGQTAKQNEYLKANLNVTLQAASLLSLFRRTSFATDWLTRWASYFDDQLDVERLRIKHQRAETEDMRSEIEELEIQSANDRELLALEDAEILPNEQKYQTAMNTIRGYLRSVDRFADLELILHRLSERKKQLPVGFDTLKLVGYFVDAAFKGKQYSSQANLRHLLSKEEQMNYSPVITKVIPHFVPSQSGQLQQKDLVECDNSMHVEWLLCDADEKKGIFKDFDAVSISASLLCCPTCGVALAKHGTRVIGIHPLIMMYGVTPPTCMTNKLKEVREHR
ncbi:hypothetical protein C8J56DRAFT_62649 [Mycena floridula]|nr:hypothetical protein C8J56DRAFT_62649 [Mycena floridula]